MGEGDEREVPLKGGHMEGHRNKDLNSLANQCFNHQTFQLKYFILLIRIGIINQFLSPVLCFLKPFNINKHRKHVEKLFLNIEGTDN